MKKFKIFTLVAALIASGATYSIDKDWSREVVLVDGISIEKEATQEKVKVKLNVNKPIN